MFLEGRAASSRELAAEVGLTPSATSYHVRKLREVGLIEPVDTRRRRAFDERVWRTRASGWATLARLLAETAPRRPRPRT